MGVWIGNPNCTQRNEKKNRTLFWKNTNDTQLIFSLIVQILSVEKAHMNF